MRQFLSCAIYRVHPEIAESISSGVLSMKSDNSMEQPIEFKGLGEVLCDICSAVQAVKFCQTCSVSYCETHIRWHYTVPKLQRHILVEVSDDLEEKLCQEHHRPLEVFCRTEQMFICSLCSGTKHRGHDTIHGQMKTSERQSKTFEGNKHQILNSDYEVGPPENIQVQLLTSDSVSLSWSSPQWVEGPQKFRVTWECGWEKISSRVKGGHHLEITSLKPGEKYLFTVATEGDDGRLSRCISASSTTVVPPRDVKVDNVEYTSFSLHWTKGEGMETIPQRFLISYSSPGTDPHAVNTEGCYWTFSNLQPGTEYTVDVVTILTNGEDSEPVSITICTEVPAPSDLSIKELKSTSFTIRWTKGSGLDQTPQHFLISYSRPGKKPTTEYTDDCYRTLSDLEPGTQYTVSVSTVLTSGQESDPVSTNIYTGSFLKELLSKTGLSEHFPNKLMLSKVLEINANTTSDEPLTTVQSLPGSFLKKLMMANVKARSSNSMSTDTNVSCRGIDSFENMENDSDNVNPLDLITAVILCSDGFLQQEMVQKMSMCQFAVPLLLPNCDTKQSTLMLWALRDIVKRFKPSSQATTKSFKEESIVISDVPMVSFVRLGECSLSKSKILNKLLSNAEQYHDTFVHRDMEYGDVPRRISDGLVEISWYFPCGNRNIDIYTEPVAVANLRGDIRSFEKQFSFLCQTSAAVYIFSDHLEDDFFTVLKRSKTHAEIFLVVNSQERTFKVETLKNILTKSGIHERNVIVKKKQNDAEFVKALQSSVGDILRKHPNILNIENMSKEAHQIGILIDEDCEECQRASKMAEAITSKITDTMEFKDKQLPFQGSIWNKLSQLEKERCRLRKIGDQKSGDYISSLKEQEKKLREKQNRLDMSDAMAQFISGMSISGAQRSYFLKWMRINLDDQSRQNLSDLRERYKDLCQNSPEKTDKIKLLDKQISDSSLGLEHFLRELGQLYESARSLPEDRPERQQMEQLPGLCAQMLLDGFPVELVDGDASNIPLKWISAVLTQLHSLVDSKSKIRVVTVLGVQSTGKSTLLNTMFGVQFAVSSGRCTRGAFMLLLKVNKDLKEELKCDFIMVIDTEGLKSPELAQLDDSYEHDNELATLVIGLSDVTIINIAMENSTEMKDILQIVVHAFIRMKEVGKKPICHFVHQNVSDMSAHDNNMRDRKKLLEQLDEMTKAAARMEKNESYTRFTDVMDYDPDTSSSYIPGLWHGTPPMAPVNAGYSEAVYDFKKSVMQDFIKCRSNDDLTHFLKWTESLWESVKFEKFIFSFRNSLVADAYSKLCTEYNSWEWSFQKKMYEWMVNAETIISNHGMLDQSTQKPIREVLNELMTEVSEKIDLQEKRILENLANYFNMQDGHVNLVEKYREGFVSSAKTLKRETDNTIRNSLNAAVEIKEGMAKLVNIKSAQASTMEKKVLALLQSCRQKKTVLHNQDLEKVFESMWMNTMSEISFRGIEKQDVAHGAFRILSSNLSMRGGVGNKTLVVNNLKDCGETSFIVKPDGFLKKITGAWSHRDINFYRKQQQELCDNIIK
uniref:Uncharacterized protein n=1 Tax=Esox lucius TaxID=8010 RepID=A0A3P8Y460_ESOLU